MIKTKDLVPEIYNTSHDYKIFEALLDAVFNKSDVNSKSLQNLHNPGKCLQENLYRLAAFFDLPTADRVLLKYYRLLRKSKGTRGAVESAIEACGAEIKSDPIIVSSTPTQISAAEAPIWRTYKYYTKSGDEYFLQEEEPDDWSTNYSNYYVFVATPWCHISYQVTFENFDSKLFDVLRRRLIEFNCQLQLIPYIDQ